MTLPSVRAKVNAGSEEFLVTGDAAPAFLYENPDTFNPKTLLSGFLRGYFLARVSCLFLRISEARTNLVAVFTCTIHRSKVSHESSSFRAET